MIDVSIIVYLDDILIYSNNPANYCKYIKEVLWRLRKHGLFARSNKCEFHSEWGWTILCDVTIQSQHCDAMWHTNFLKHGIYALHFVDMRIFFTSNYE